MTREDKKNTETLTSSECRPEAEEVVQFVEELDQEGREKFLEFIRGARFALALQTETKQAI